ncbi:hypothetical protein Pmani_038642 [Petrolisthes manimaculis]|uniref:Uncharacterized protein n=1 Tax=Petrolisthes manimaculis TaxID=1843537 RepID=A0AAE1NE05_9EUCA|nr:hypothetical protein Pmani_038642 [Petrolisthes manimaculis]
MLLAVTEAEDGVSKKGIEWREVSVEERDDCKVTFELDREWSEDRDRWRREGCMEQSLLDPRIGWVVSPWGRRWSEEM